MVLYLAPTCITQVKILMLIPLISNYLSVKIYQLYLIILKFNSKSAVFLVAQITTLGYMGGGQAVHGCLSCPPPNLYKKS